VFPQIFQAQLAGARNVHKSFFDRFSVRIASGKGRAHNCKAAVLVWLEKYFAVQGLAAPMLTRRARIDKSEVLAAAQRRKAQSDCRNKKGSDRSEPFLVLILAVTYVPASFPAQYHRPGKA
jgi:hypothetical protein